MNFKKKFFENLSSLSFSFILLGTLITASAITGGGILPISLTLVSLILFLFIYLRFKSKSEIYKIPRTVLVFIAIFVLFSFISIFNSYDIHQSVVVFFWLTLSIVLGLEAYSLVKEKDGLVNFSNVMILSSTIVVVVGFFLYFIFDDYVNLRFISTFFQPNAFAGFLLLPLSLLLPLFVSTVENKRKILFGILSILTLTAFILTVSRGAMVIFSAVWFFVFLFSLIKKEHNLKLLHFFKIFFVLFISIILAIGIFKLKMSYATPSSVTPISNSVFGGGATKEGAVNSRFEYMRTSVLISKGNLLHGVGIGAYREAETKYRDNVIFETNDPHNLYLRIFSEIGFLGGSSFFVLISILGLFSLSKLWRMNFSSFLPVEIGMIAGVFSIILHNFMDVDWFFPANMMLSIIAFFVLFSFLSSKDDKFSLKSVVVIRTTAIVVVSVVTLASFFIFLGNNYGMDGPYFDRKGNKEEAVNSFNKGLYFDKYNPDVLSDYSLYFFNQADVVSDKNNKIYFLNKSLYMINSAIKIKPNNFYYYNLRADVYKEIGDLKSFEDDLKKGIENNKTLNLDSYIKLSQKYLEEKRYAEVVSLVDEVLGYYPPGVFEDSFWANPDKPMLGMYFFILNSNKIDALEKLNKKEEVKKAQDFLKLY